MLNKIFTFLSLLQKNNSREWYHANKELFLEARDNFEILATQILRGCTKFDTSLENTNLKNCLFKIHNDTRFRKDKTPFKTSLSCFFKERGKRSLTAGYYVHIEPNNCFIAGGIYQPEKLILKKILNAIDIDGDELNEIVNKPKFKKYFSTLEGEKFKRIPKGLDPQHKYGEWLKMKSFLVRYSFKENELTDKNIIKKAVEIFELMFSLIKWINQNLEYVEY